jgi:hypothetical protein
VRRYFINSFLRIFKVWGDCSFVVEEAEVWILWDFTEAHQTIGLSKAQKSIKNIDKFLTYFLKEWFQKII